MERRTRIAAYAWAVRNNAVLLARIAPGRPEEGRWTLPGGGIEWGEHPEMAMHRELYEETGLRAEVTGFIGVDSITVHATDLPDSPHIHSLRLVYRVHAGGNEPGVTEIEGTVDAARWWPLADLPGIPAVDLVGFALEKSGDDIG